MKNRRSLYAFWFAALFVFSVGFFYYPKWKKSRTEATLSWDVSGYYFYLPATFIYKDLKQLSFKDSILQKYGPTPELQQAFLHESGNYVLKYSCGQALQYLPFFGAAHLIARFSDYPADGFSPPYQLLISIGSWLIAFLGLWYLRKTLLLFFSDTATAITILLIVTGSNYLDYAAINGAMTHNNLFTIYCLLLWTTHLFYKNPSSGRAISIGILVGLAALTRPTEIISCLIPLLWGLSGFRWSAIQERIGFFKKHLPKLALAILVTALIGSLQPIYWKYATGEWIVYSYQDQGFSWLRPHFYMGILSAQSGWLVYSPMLIFALLGFIFLYRKASSVFWMSLIFSLLFIYITFAWDIWTYGGGLGIRAMVQCYAVLALPMAAFVSWVLEKGVWKWVFGAICVVFIYYNLWLTHQAHLGGLLKPGAMTNAYFWRILGRYEVPKDVVKLLDNKDRYEGQPLSPTTVYTNDFEMNSLYLECPIPAISGNISLCLNKEQQFGPQMSFPLAPSKANWLRATATFQCDQREWNIWRSTIFYIKLFKGDQMIRQRYLRVYRLLQCGQPMPISSDMKLPDQEFDRVAIEFWNSDGEKPIAIDNLEVVVFED